MMRSSSSPSTKVMPTCTANCTASTVYRPKETTNVAWCACMARCTP
jgi:hypothetical protein